MFNIGNIYHDQPYCNYHVLGYNISLNTVTDNPIGQDYLIDILRSYCVAKQTLMFLICFNVAVFCG